MLAAAGWTVAGTLFQIDNPRLEVPPGSCDCHTHVFEPSRFPFATERTYTPGAATVDQLRALHKTLGIGRVVIVQPSVYGTDNACTLEALQQLRPHARGIGVIGARTPEAELLRMRAGGIAGIRVNLGTAGVTDPERALQQFRVALVRAVDLNWHVQVFTQLSVIQALRDDVLASPVPVVFDHFGGARGSLGLSQPGFDVLLDLVARGRAYVKISGAYRGSTQAPDYPDMAPLAQALIAANPERILWGTDWPHPDTVVPAGKKATDVSPFLPIDDVRLLNQLATWAPDAAVRKRILADNPARLYGF